MAVAFRSVSTNLNASGGGVVVDKPTGTADYDILLLHVACNNTSITTPTGWTLLQSNFPGSGYAIFWKQALSEGANYSISTTGTRVAAAIMAISGAAIVTPIGGSNFQNNGSSSTCTTLGVTPLANSLIAVFAGADSSVTASAQTITTSTPTFVEQYDFPVSGAGPAISAATGVRAAATATGTGTTTLSGSSANTGFMIAVSPGLDVTAPTTTLFSTTAFLGVAVMAPFFSATVTLFSGLMSKWSAAAKSVTTWTNTPKS